MKIPNDGVWITSAIKDNQPAVGIHFEGKEQILFVNKARDFAAQLIYACTIAEVECAIFDGLNSLENGNATGFGRKPKNKETSISTVALKALETVRRFRRKMPYGIQAFRGLRTERPIVAIPWDREGGELQLEILEAKNVAQNIFEAAEAAETDKFLANFFLQVGIPEDEIGLLIQEFIILRQKTTLETTFRESS